VDVRPVLQPLMDLQPGSAVLAVDEDLGLVRAHGLLSRKFRALGIGRLEKGGRVGSRLILSSGFTIRRACYARASLGRSRERRRRDRKGANEVIAGAYFIHRSQCQGHITPKEQCLAQLAPAPFTQLPSS